MTWTRMKMILSLCMGAMYLSACGGDSHDHAHDHDHDHGRKHHDHDHEGHAHEHTAPRGGTLVVFGEEFAHIEMLLDSTEGKLNVYVLDGEAENAVRIAQDKIEIAFTSGVTGATELALPAVASSLTGETVGDTSEFGAQSDALKAVEKFEATVKAISIKGQEFKDVAFKYPDGNE